MGEYLSIKPCHLVVSVRLLPADHLLLWFVGDMINRGDDKIERFIDAGIWENVFENSSRASA